MKGIVLAAGRGSRLERLTANRPKCLTELAGRSLLKWQLRALAAAGVEDVVVVRGYRAELLDGPYKTVDNVRWDETNMVASLACAAEHLYEGPAVVSYADIVYHPGIVSALAAASRQIAITYDTRWEELWRLRFDNPLEDAESFKVTNGTVREIGSKPHRVDEIEGQYMGLLRLTPRGWAECERIMDAVGAAERDAMDMTTLLRRVIRDGVEIEAIPVAGRWCEVDTPTDLARYESAVRRIPVSEWSHDWRWKEGSD